MTNDIERVLETAFADVSRPGETELRVFEGTEEKIDTAPFENKAWQSIDTETIVQHYCALYWFTPEAFLYYLPSFLRAGINSPQALHVITVLQLLEPTQDSTLAQFRRERWRLLSDGHNRALDAWLSSLEAQARPSQKGEFEDALRVVRERYWSR